MRLAGFLAVAGGFWIAAPAMAQEDAQTLQPARLPGMCLAIAGPAGEAQSQPCKGGADEIFNLPGADGGPIRIAGKCLAAAGEGVVAAACDGSPAQAWTMSAKGELRSAAGRCLSLPGASSRTGAPILAAACPEGEADLWRAGEARVTHVIDASFESRARAGQCIGHEPALALLDCSDATRQAMSFDEKALTHIRIAGACLSGGLAGALKLADCWDMPEEKWTLREDGRIANQNADCIEIVNEDGRDLLKTAPCSTEPLQVWSVRRAQALAPVQTAAVVTTFAPDPAPLPSPIDPATAPIIVAAAGTAAVDAAPPAPVTSVAPIASPAVTDTVAVATSADLAAPPVELAANASEPSPAPVSPAAADAVAVATSADPIAPPADPVPAVSEPMPVAPNALPAVADTVAVASGGDAAAPPTDPAPAVADPVSVAAAPAAPVVLPAVTDTAAAPSAVDPAASPADPAPVVTASASAPATTPVPVVAPPARGLMTLQHEQLPGMCVSLSGPGGESENRPCDGSAAQEFQLPGVDGGQIRQGDKCIAARGGGRYPQLAAETCNGMPEQFWFINAEGVVRNAAGSCLALLGASSRTGERVYAGECPTTLPAQHWRAVVIDPALLKPVTAMFELAARPGRCLGSDGALGLVECNQRLGRLFSLNAAAPSQLRLMNNCLTSGYVFDGVTLGQCWDIPAQKWSLLPGGQLSSGEGKCIAVVTENGRDALRAGGCQAAPEQVWTLREAAP